MESGQIICKNCGGPLDPRNAVNGVLQCKYCNSVWTVPNEEEPLVLDLLRQGEHDLDACEFQRAFLAFQKAAEIGKHEPEAQFGMALSTYHVQYLRDEVHEKLIPICYGFKQFEKRPFSENTYYKNAIQFATPAQREVYKERARKIDSIRETFLRLMREKKNRYDVFLCTKVSKEDGSKETTQESHEAMKIYQRLVGQGFRPFYSEVDLFGTEGEDYEARLLYALYTSSCMLIVCFHEEYLNTKWVRNEYTRFIKMFPVTQKQLGSVAFVYRDRPIEELPGQDGSLQGFDWSSGFAFDGIKQYIERHREKEETEPVNPEALHLPQTAKKAPVKKGVPLKPLRAAKAFSRGERCRERGDHAMAAEYYSMAAKQGHIGAQSKLGMCYEKGLGVSQDIEEAKKFYRQAAKQGCIDSQYSLGRCYYEEQNYEEAVKWLRRAAERGHSLAQHDLGICYQTGNGVKTDEETAVVWYQKAAVRNDNGAKGALLGLGIKPPRTTARHRDEDLNGVNGVLFKGWWVFAILLALFSAILLAMTISVNATFGFDEGEDVAFTSIFIVACLVCVVPIVGFSIVMSHNERLDEPDTSSWMSAIYGIFCSLLLLADVLSMNMGIMNLDLDDVWPCICGFGICFVAAFVSTVLMYFFGRLKFIYSLLLILTLLLFGAALGAGLLVHL